jgi:hypothetical protein
MNHSIMVPVFSTYGLQSSFQRLQSGFQSFQSVQGRSLSEIKLCNVKSLMPAIIDYIEEFDETSFVRACMLMILIMYLSYLVSDKMTDDGDSNDDAAGDSNDDAAGETDDSKESSVEDEEILSTSTDDTPSVDDEEISVEPEELLRFHNNDTKFDQAANILAYIYSCGLTLPGVSFPLASWSIQNKRIKIKEVSFMRKVKKYREAPSENMRMLILRKPTLRQLMEAYTYYSNLDGRSIPIIPI